jgi:hypothetical protein
MLDMDTFNPKAIASLRLVLSVEEGILLAVKSQLTATVKVSYKVGDKEGKELGL